MNTRRELLLAVGASALAASLSCFAQQQGNVRRIGFLGARSRSTPSNPDVYYDAFVQGMRELGYVQGKNLVIEWRFADEKFERLPALASELVRLQVEVIVAQSTPATEAAQRATGTIPIVMTGSADPIGSGFAASLARPGGNITGLSLLSVDLIPKFLELLKIMMPALSNTAVLINPANSTHAAVLTSVQAAERQHGVKVLPVNARTPEELERGFAAMERQHAGAVIIPTDSFFLGQRHQIAELALKRRLPSIFNTPEYPEAGGLMSYGQNLVDSYRRAATYVDKIFKGAKAGELPIEQPSVITFVINRKTAKAIGLAIPQELLLRADRVIE